MESLRPRKIVFLESAASMGGVQFSTLYLAGALDRSRWYPMVVCPGEGDLARACRDAGIETDVLKYPRLWSTSIRAGSVRRLPNPFAWIRNAMVMMRAVGSLSKFLRQTRPDLLVTKGLASHFIGGLASRRLSIPCIWHVQDLISERSFGIYRHVFGLASRRLPHHIIVDGRAIKEQLPRSIDSRVSVIHNGVDTNDFHPGRDGSRVRRELGIRSEQFVIGHAGRITPWKGQHYLIEAFVRIAGDFPNVVVLLAGSPVFDHDGYERRLRATAAAYGLQERVIFAGYRHDLPDVLAAMDMFAFTSVEKDTSPLALLSAMASGLPIVAFDIEGVTELLDNHEVLCVKVGDTKELARGIETLIRERGRESRYAQAARQLAERKFDLRRYVNRIEEVLSSSDSIAESQVVKQKTQSVTTPNHTERKRRYVMVAAIFVFALTVRVGFVNYFHVSELGGGDGPSLETMARTITRGETARSNEGYAFRMPGFPFLMAQVYRFSEGRYGVYLLQSVIGALSAVILLLLLMRWNRFAAIVASGILSLHPLMLLFTKQILTENVSVLLFLTITYLALLTINKARWAIPLGFVWGAFILTRSEAVLTVVPTIAFVAFLSKERRLFKVLAPTAVALIIASSWAYRNYQVVGIPTLQTALGLNLYMSFNPSAKGTYYDPPPPPGVPNAESEQNGFYIRQALSFIGHNRTKALKLVGAKQFYFWHPWNNRLLDALDLLLLPLACAGIFIARRNSEQVLLLAPIVGITFLFIVFQAVNRYRVPIYPFAISFAAIALTQLISAIKPVETPSIFRQIIQNNPRVRRLTD